MKINHHPTPLKASHPVKALKTPEPQRRHARNWHRRKRDIPEDAPLGTRREPFNKARRGHGNVTKEVSMPQAAWDRIDATTGPNETRGEFITRILVENEELKQAALEAETDAEDVAWRKGWKP